MSASESAYAEEPVQTTCQMEETSHLPRRPPSPDRAGNTALPAAQGDTQSWISDLARQTDARSSFNELFDTPIDFSNFIMHQLNVDTLTPDLLVGHTYELMRGSCTSLTELEYHLEEKGDVDRMYAYWMNQHDDMMSPLCLVPMRLLVLGLELDMKVQLFFDCSMELCDVVDDELLPVRHLLIIEANDLQGIRRTLLMLEILSRRFFLKLNLSDHRSILTDLQMPLIKEQVKNGVIEVYFVNMKYQLADLFTKALGRDRIEFLINKLGMRSFTPETLKQLMDDVDE
nr:ribonuclease H [Tanacetum cinerariifolium]